MTVMFKGIPIIAEQSFLGSDPDKSKGVLVEGMCNTRRKGINFWFYYLTLQEGSSKDDEDNNF